MSVTVMQRSRDQVSTHSIELIERETETGSVNPLLEFASVAIEERDSEISQLRERLNYYQGFDAVIGDSVQRAAELFRSMFEERESIRNLGAQKQAEIAAEATMAAELRFTTERDRFQSTLMTLMDDASRMQRDLETLMHRIAEAVAESKSAPPIEHPAYERLTA